MKTKEAISPLIATVLIIGFAIAIVSIGIAFNLTDKLPMSWSMSLVPINEVVQGDEVLLAQKIHVNEYLNYPIKIEFFEIYIDDGLYKRIEIMEYLKNDDYLLRGTKINSSEFSQGIHHINTKLSYFDFKRGKIEELELKLNLEVY